MGSSRFLKVDFSINIERKASYGRHFVNPPHYHNACEIHYYLNGGLNFFIHDQSFDVKKGDILFIDTYELHNPIYRSICDYDKILITYKPSFTEMVSEFKIPDMFSLLNRKYDGVRLISVPENLRQKIEGILFNMLDAGEKQNEYTLTYLHLYLSLLITHMTDYLDSTDKPDNQHSSLNKTLNRIIMYINNNLEKQLSLDEISGYLNMNKYYLCRFFKEYTGLTVIDYINRKRIIAAEKLITSNKHSITDIAVMVGFNSLTHFERTFKQFTGTAPSRYRLSLSDTSEETDI